MLEYPLILLQRSNDDGDGFGRFLGIIIFILIFVIGNLAQWWQKYQEQKKKQDLQRRAQQQANPQPQRPTARAPQRPAPQPRRAGPAPVQRKTPAPAAQRQPQPQRKAQPQRLPPLPQKAPAAVAVQVDESSEPAFAHKASQDISATEIGGAMARRSMGDRRTEFLRTILTPRSLKQAYVVTEILQSPVALRDATQPGQR